MTLADRELGALTLVDLLSRGEALPAQGAAVALSEVQVRAPLPHPRRNIFCVGKNYHAHAKELSATVFKDNNADPNAWPIVFSKVP
jgi:2-keto-4-pentenoate hydratase/2-oxohepta-3-ene-1,7-dioic acid hydratase in catechol pathway